MALKEAPEGIVFSSSSGIIYSGDVLGQDYKDSEVLGLSKSQIETLDLISEGPIQGLVSGKYLYSGNLGEVGWRTASFTGFSTPFGYEGLSYLRSIYFNEIPILNDDGKLNFQSFNISTTIGKPNGAVLQTLSPYQTSSKSIGERLYAENINSKTYRILNPDCRAVVVNIKIQGLTNTNSSNGNIERTTVEYTISYRPLFNNNLISDYTFGKREVIFGKITTSSYVRTSRIDFTTNTWGNSNFIGWELKIERLTADSKTSLLSNNTYVDSITEIQGNIYTFPYCALVRGLFDAQYFQSVPERAFEMELLKVKVPGNYNPLFRTYNVTGFATTNSGWNGQFATGTKYTNNPAWCYYDLLVNPRYGLGKYVDSNFVDKWELYNISKYCDTLVADGLGGLEPRFTCNLLINSREDAYKVVNDMASAFRGLTYYANGLIYTSQDRERNQNEIISVFTNANVEDGDFNYSTTSRRNRHSVAIIRYNDPLNFYKPAIEYVEDFNAIRKYGIKEIETTAFGCTSKGQAIRLGRWILTSDTLETESITFNAGIEAARLKPGDVFKVFDYNRKLKRNGGRTLELSNINSTGAYVVLDGLVDLEPNIEYGISFVTPSFEYNSSQVTGLNSNDYSNIRKSFIQKFSFSGWQAQTSGTRTILNIFSGFDTGNYNINNYPAWCLELTDNYLNYSGARYFTNLNSDYYRIINLKELDTHRYQVEGLQYNPQKYLEIESGLLFGRDIINAPKIPETPKSLTFNLFPNNNNTLINYSFLVDNYSNIDSYRVYVTTGQFAGNGLPDPQLLKAILPSNTTFGTYIAQSTGNYKFRIYSSNDINGILSPNFASSSVNVYGGVYITIQYQTMNSLRLQNNVTGQYSGNSNNNYISVITNNDSSPIFTWQPGFSNSIDNSDVKYRVTIRNSYDSQSRIPSDTILYQESGIETNQWEFTLDKNINSINGPHRDYQIVVEGYTPDGKTSAGNQIGVEPDAGWNLYPNGYDILSISNPRQTGIELKNQIPTQLSGDGDFITGNRCAYNNFSYIGPNGDVTIQYTSGVFDADLAGGYLYVSTGKFPKIEALNQSGDWSSIVSKTRFDFNPLNPYIYAPTAAFNLKNYKMGFVSVSFYDSIDKELINHGINISTGLYLSNNAPIYNDAKIGNLNLGGGGYGGQTIQIIKYSGDAVGAGYGGFDWTNSIIISSGVVSGITSIVYMNPAETSNLRW